MDKIQHNTNTLGVKNALVDLTPIVTLFNPVEEPSLNISSMLEEKPTQKGHAECDMFNGRWVYKAEDKPSYNAVTCPFLEIGVTCQKNGRPDFDYAKWRWEATDCDIPLFNGRDMLERLRNKRMVVVGDSLNRNMWESLACLLYSSIPSSTVEVVNLPASKSLKAKDYNFTVEFYMAPFLVDLDKKHVSGRRVLNLDRISPYSKQWEGADFMVFNSAHWWTHGKAIRSWDLFRYKGKLVEDMAKEVAYKRGMRTWASWIKKNVDPRKTIVYFRSVSPTHYHPHFCFNATQPLIDAYDVKGFPKSLMDVIENLTKKMTKLRVNYLNITKLSAYRMDAHPSIYDMDMNNSPNKVEDNLKRPIDCSHWCLPGLPDTWNRLLYASILLDI
ncbi:protein trichome birefringence-like 40 [Amaranthus tricolor]|uniref:protein trichome birefringence-like 40 n=1 Tax=Amaranthus tricolor TaxID=29722 RepID=UPI00258398D8|nr:protein trichome birefringence-like 40 [Amaranthus tricolor]